MSLARQLFIRRTGYHHNTTVLQHVLDESQDVLLTTTVEIDFCLCYSQILMLCAEAVHYKSAELVSSSDGISIAPVALSLSCHNVFHDLLQRAIVPEWCASRW